jgi:hypothetical protein
MFGNILPTWRGIDDFAAESGPNVSHSEDIMRVFAPILLALMIAPALAASDGTVTTQTILPGGAGAAPEVGLRLLKEYRTKPTPESVPLLMRGLSERGAFKDPEASGVYIGFFAGVLGSNPKTAKSLIEKTLPLPFEDQWIVVKALAYSGLPKWRELMIDLATKLPDRRTLIDYYLTGKMPRLIDARLEPEKPDSLAKMKRIFKKETYFGAKEPAEKPRELTFATNPELIDTHWGLYFATGMDGPIHRLVDLLPWSKDRDSVDKLTIGNMAKFTLAANAAYDVKLLRTLKRMKTRQSDKVEPILREVIEAAEIADTGRIKKEALAALDDLRKKGPGSKRDIAWWGSAGQTVISAGCMGAALTGQVQFGIPCVVGGALSSAALRYFASPE